MASKQPLSSSYQRGSPSSIVLYDEECILDICPDKSQGFLVLLNGTDKTLAFMALTDGNLIDACVGAPPQIRQGVRYERSRAAKNTLAVASDSSESISPLAIETYKRGFGIVVDHHAKIKRTFFCCRCFVQGRIRKKAKAELKKAFQMLYEAVEASSS
mmetsp:Transcript_28528/g.47217  ORF Transcript_28528/g.47217 Transcript_28528/m.47217 type:complete len:158 (-) Transcript_28528:222-695(-)|eukprot:CAMPEP_0119014724 /NCGR_PEP_ID=MMETSP1176-20130426/10286_1 /TAXON_ID=265551 /ORGANISM="Synedropsis recta cf, Strain CCMP1620" /LENGTH=157 /DNA_ID=CAMNT_0006967953 /DNA_START=173 /DNA_END=646 /DNA_ORIENTATION=-